MYFSSLGSREFTKDLRESETSMRRPVIWIFTAKLSV
jgi:hypothetical protein